MKSLKLHVGFSTHPLKQLLFFSEASRTRMSTGAPSSHAVFLCHVASFKRLTLTYITHEQIMVPIKSHMNTLYLSRVLSAQVNISLCAFQACSA